MKKFLKAYRVLCVILSFLLVIASLSSINAFAASSDNEYTEITLLEDQQTLICGDKTYYCFKFEPARTYYLDPISTYHYANNVVRKDGGSRATAYASYKGAESMWIKNSYGETYYFYTEAEKEHISNEFLKEKFTYRRIWTSDNTYSDVSEHLVYSLQELYETKATTRISVKRLETAKKYRLSGYDRTNTFAYELGYIYDLDGDLIYIAHSKLSDDYFDSNGNFVYVGTGSVNAHKLSGSMLKTVKELIDTAKPAEFTNTYENDRYNYDYDDSYEYDPDEYKNGILIAFWIVYFIFGIAAPIPIIIVGYVLGKKKKNDHPKYWRSISFSAAAWLFISLVLLAVLLVI